VHKGLGLEKLSLPWQASLWFVVLARQWLHDVVYKVQGIPVCREALQLLCRASACNDRMSHVQAQASLVLQGRGNSKPILSTR